MFQTSAGSFTLKIRLQLKTWQDKIGVGRTISNRSVIMGHDQWGWRSAYRSSPGIKCEPVQMSSDTHPSIQESWIRLVRGQGAQMAEFGLKSGARQQGQTLAQEGNAQASG
jgi:hypothetical protein